MSTQSAVLRSAGSRGLQSHWLTSLLLEAVERVLALAVLAALAPCLVLIAAAIAVLSGKAPLVAHRRVGRNDESFWVLKFRTMWNGRRDGVRSPLWVEYLVDEDGPNQKRSSDPRVTHAFAHFCRRHSVDELPQLVHVVTGRMSFVGPRPLTRTELDTYYGRSVRKVLSAKPGLTGLWQVMGRSRLTYRQRARLDLFYVQRRSIGLNLGILVRTIPQVLAGRNSW